MCNFISHCNMSFTNRLQGVDTLYITLPHLHDFTKATFPNDRDEFKVINGQRLALMGFVNNIFVKGERQNARRLAGT